MKPPTKFQTMRDNRNKARNYILPAKPDDGKPARKLTPVSDLEGLSPRAHNALKLNCVLSVEQLMGLSEKELLNMPNMGKGSLKNISFALLRAGYSPEF